VKRTIDKNVRQRVAGNLYNQVVTIKVRDREFQGQAGDTGRGREPPLRP